MDNSTAVLGGGLLAVAILILSIIVLVAWVFLPFMLYSRLGEIARILRDINLSLEASKWQAPQQQKPLSKLPPGIVRGP